MIFDSTYIIFVVPAILLSFIAQSMVKGSYNKYSKVSSNSGLTGKEVAEVILKRHNINGISVVQGRGELTDHFDPRNNTVALSQGVYNSSSVAAVAIAAHEIGHVVQHSEGYGPLKLRAALVPLANIGANFSWLLFFAGLIFEVVGLMNIGILMYAMSFLFTLITLPVEIDASKRALMELNNGIIGSLEIDHAKKVLRAAAFTYVAAMLASLLQLLRLVALRDKNRD